VYAAQGNDGELRLVTEFSHGQQDESGEENAMPTFLLDCFIVIVRFGTQGMDTKGGKEDGHRHPDHVFRQPSGDGDAEDDRKDALDALTAAFAPLRTHTWAYPALEVVHIVGIALLLGNLVLLELRVFGRGAALPVPDLARLSLTLVAIGFSLAAVSGTVMFATQPGDLLANRAFTLKMLLLFVAGSNAAMFHARQSLDKMDRAARLHMIVSTVVWVAIIALGRWIAYV